MSEDPPDSPCSTEGSRGTQRYHPWAREEDELLKAIVAEKGPKNWASIAKSLPARTGKSCRLRWVNQLRDDIKSGPFSAEEDEIVVQAHQRLGNKWTSIAKLLPGRTDNAVKNRWNAALRKRVEDQAALHARQLQVAAVLASLGGHHALLGGLTQQQAATQLLSQAGYCQPMLAQATHQAAAQFEPVMPQYTFRPLTPAEYVPHTMPAAATVGVSLGLILQQLPLSHPHQLMYPPITSTSLQHDPSNMWNMPASGCHEDVWASLPESFQQLPVFSSPYMYSSSMGFEPLDPQALGFSPPASPRFARIASQLQVSGSLSSLMPPIRSATAVMSSSAMAPMLGETTRFGEVQLGTLQKVKAAAEAGATHEGLLQAAKTGSSWHPHDNFNSGQLYGVSTPMWPVSAPLAGFIPMSMPYALSLSQPMAQRMFKIEQDDILPASLAHAHPRAVPERAQWDTSNKRLKFDPLSDIFRITDGPKGLNQLPATAQYIEAMSQPFQCQPVKAEESCDQPSTSISLPVMHSSPQSGRFDHAAESPTDPGLFYALPFVGSFPKLVDLPRWGGGSIHMDTNDGYTDSPTPPGEGSQKHF